MNNVTFENLDNKSIMFRNFSGKESQYNRKGDRKFSLKLGEKDAEAMKKDGWNVKEWITKDGETIYHLPVAVRFDTLTPMVYSCNSKSHRMIRVDENRIQDFDGLSFENVDLTIRPYKWTANGNTGVKAYLSKMIVIPEDDLLTSKYADYAFDEFDEDDDDVPF